MARQNDVLRGHGETIGARMAGDTAVFMGLPATPFEPCDKPARVSAFSLVRYRGSDYSVPTRFGHREVLVKGFVDAVVICHGADVIARHVRSYQTADFVFDPLHYLALLERKTGALDQAAPRRTGSAGRIRHLAAVAGSADGEARPARVRPGAAVDGGLPCRGRDRRRPGARCRWARSASMRIKHLVLCRIERPPSSICPALPVLARCPGADHQSRRLRHPHDREWR